MPDLLGEGINLFNAGSYFDAHEVWEDMWRVTTGPSRDFYQGLIHATVALYHLSKENRNGAQSQIEKSLKKLEPYPSDYCGINVAELQQNLRLILEENLELNGRSIQISRNFR